MTEKSPRFICMKVSHPAEKKVGIKPRKKPEFKTRNSVGYNSLISIPIDDVILSTIKKNKNENEMCNQDETITDDEFSSFSETEIKRRLKKEKDETQPAEALNKEPGQEKNGIFQDVNYMQPPTDFKRKKSFESLNLNEMPPKTTFTFDFDENFEKPKENLFCASNDSACKSGEYFNLKKLQEQPSITNLKNLQEEITIQSLKNLQVESLMQNLKILKEEENNFNNFKIPCMEEKNFESLNTLNNLNKFVSFPLLQEEKREITFQNTLSYPSGDNLNSFPQEEKSKQKLTYLQRAEVMDKKLKMISYDEKLTPKLNKCKEEQNYEEEKIIQHIQDTMILRNLEEENILKKLKKSIKLSEEKSDKLKKVKNVEDVKEKEFKPNENENKQKKIILKEAKEMKENLPQNFSPILQNVEPTEDDLDITSCNASIENLEQNSLINLGRWTTLEHNKFLQAMFLYGNEWKKVQEYIITRSSTQARSHAQKYFLSMRKKFESESKVLLTPQDKLNRILAWIEESIPQEIIKLVNKDGHRKFCKVIINLMSGVKDGPRIRRKSSEIGSLNEELFPLLTKEKFDQNLNQIKNEKIISNNFDIDDINYEDGPAEDKELLMENLLNRNYVFEKKSCTTMNNNLPSEVTNKKSIDEKILLKKKRKASRDKIFEIVKNTKNEDFTNTNSTKTFNNNQPSKTSDLSSTVLDEMSHKNKPQNQNTKTKALTDPSDYEYDYLAHNKNRNEQESKPFPSAGSTPPGIVNKQFFNPNHQHYINIVNINIDKGASGMTNISKTLSNSLGGLNNMAVNNTNVPAKNNLSNLTNLNNLNEMSSLEQKIKNSNSKNDRNNINKSKRKDGKSEKKSFYECFSRDQNKMNNIIKGDTNQTQQNVNLNQQNVNLNQQNLNLSPQNLNLNQPLTKVETSDNDPNNSNINNINYNDIYRLSNSIKGIKNNMTHPIVQNYQKLCTMLIQNSLRNQSPNGNIIPLPNNFNLNAQNLQQNFGTNFSNSFENAKMLATSPSNINNFNINNLKESINHYNLMAKKNSISELETKFNNFHANPLNNKISDKNYVLNNFSANHNQTNYNSNYQNNNICNNIKNNSNFSGNFSTNFMNSAPPKTKDLNLEAPVANREQNNLHSLFDSNPFKLNFEDDNFDNWYKHPTNQEREDQVFDFNLDDYFKSG